MKPELDLTGKQPNSHFFCVVVVATGEWPAEKPGTASMDFPSLFPNYDGNKPIPPLPLGSVPHDQFFSVQNHQLIFSNATNWEFPFLVSWGISHWISM